MALESPYLSLSFNGQCEAAFRFYERCLGGRIVSIFTWGKSPMAGEAPPGWADKVMYASLTIGETLISGSDVPPAHYEPPRGFEIMIEPDDPVDAERIFHALRGKRNRGNADSGDVLVCSVRCARRPVRHPVVGQLREIAGAVRLIARTSNTADPMATALSRR